jgi:hypothetical protein
VPETTDEVTLVPVSVATLPCAVVAVSPAAVHVPVAEQSTSLT